MARPEVHERLASRQNLNAPWRDPRQGRGQRPAALAARCLTKGAIALSPKGRFFTDSDTGDALAMRRLMDDLRQSGVVIGGPAPMTTKDRSPFLSELDEAVNSVRRADPKQE